MSRTEEARKPRAEARVREMADENARLQRELREDAKVADVKALEKRIGELRRELDAAAKLHHEVKARLEAEVERWRANAPKALAEEHAENTRLRGAVESAIAHFRWQAEEDRKAAADCRDSLKELYAASANALMFAVTHLGRVLREAAPTSDKPPDCNPTFLPDPHEKYDTTPQGASGEWSTGAPRSNATPIGRDAEASRPERR